MTYKEAQEQVCAELNATYATVNGGLHGLLTIDNIKTAVQNAINKAWDFKPWDFAEGDKKITAIATDYYDYPQLYQAGSIYLLTVAGAEFTKISWQDYLVYKNKYSAGSEEYWAEHKRYVFINQLAVTVGQEIVMFGKLRATALSGDSDKMPFSPDSDNYENSGNRSIVLIASAELLASEKFKNITSAKEKEDKGLAMLARIWDTYAQYKQTEKPTRSQWDVDDFFGNGGKDNIGQFTRT